MGQSETSVKTHEYTTLSVDELKGDKIKVPTFQRYLSESNLDSLWESIKDNGIVRTIKLVQDPYTKQYVIIDGNHMRNALIKNAKGTTQVPVILMQASDYLQASKAFLALNNVGKQLDEIDFTQFHAEKPLSNKKYYSFLWNHVYGYGDGQPPQSKKEAQYNLEGHDKVFSPEAVRALFTGSTKEEVRGGNAKLVYDYKRKLELFDLFKINYYSTIKQFTGKEYEKLNVKFKKAALVMAIQIWLRHYDQGALGKFKSKYKRQLLRDIGAYVRDIQRKEEGGNRLSDGQSPNKQFIAVDFPNWLKERYTLK